MYLDAGPPSPADHLRQVFYRMGLNDKVISFVSHKDEGCVLHSGNMSVILTIKLLYVQEIVALSGAHTLGRSRPDRSGWGKPETKYTVYYLPFCPQVIRHNFVRVFELFQNHFLILIFDIKMPMNTDSHWF